MKISRIYIVANTSKDGSLRTLAVLKAYHANWIIFRQE